MIGWLVWTAPIVAAIAVAAGSAPPGPWLDRAFHFFGIGAIDSRRATITALVIIAVIGLATDAILGFATALETPWRQLDGLALGAVAALTVLMLAGWLNPESGERVESGTSSEADEPSAKTTAPARDGEER